MNEASTLLAAYHFNNRDNGIPSHDLFSGLDFMEGCSVLINSTKYDIRNSQSGAVAAYREALRGGLLDVVSCDIYSSRTVTLSFLAKLDEVLLVSGSSTSDALSDTGEHPLFGRTIPADSATSVIMIKYVKSISLNSLGVLHEPSAYGINFCEKLMEEGTKQNVQVLCATYDAVPDSTGSSILQGLQKLKNELPLATAYAGIIYPSDMEFVARHAFKLGMAGSGNVWIYADGVKKNRFYGIW